MILNIFRIRFKLFRIWFKRFHIWFKLFQVWCKPFNIFRLIQTFSHLISYLIFFSIWVFFHEHSRIAGLQGKGEDISLTPHYHFLPLHIRLDISRAITAESSPVNIASSRTRTGKLWFPKHKSLTTKLRAQMSLIHKNSVLKDVQK